MVQMKANVIVVRPFMKSMAPYFTPLSHSFHILLGDQAVYWFAVDDVTDYHKL